MRPVQEVLPHGVRDAADAVEACARVRLDVRAVLARARGGGPGKMRATASAYTGVDSGRSGEMGLRKMRI